MFSIRAPGERVPKYHPLRRIRDLAEGRWPRCRRGWSGCAAKGMRGALERLSRAEDGRIAE